MRINYNKPNLNLIDEFLKNEKPELFDMKTQWISIENPLERELYFKCRCCKVEDPDKCELVMSIMCVLLKGNGFDVIGYRGRHIILQDDSKIETDTANSFISLYKGALITLHPTYRCFLKKYGIKGTFMKAYEQIYEHRDEISFEKYDKELYDLLKEFALLTHSIGNFVLGPVGFNCADPKSKAKLYSARRWSTFDRMDLFLSGVSAGNTYDEWKKWYSENMMSTYTNFFYTDRKKTEDKDVALSERELVDLGDENMHIRLKTINCLIKDRGAAMVNDLRRFMDKGVWNQSF